ncbi:hypothetical protein BA177_12290 [Woeseia oceani]|uniref:Uncharacterized protein n=2 Tax=Woeseia oceani TaxID=1548547 RepID=A0A193LH63_9GAMM|nr:hypothetical protein BA177_12290 [Woeseia oceani]
MKPVAQMSAEELSALVCDALEKAGITVTLTGGACVAIWSNGQYVSKDIDFIEEGPVPRRQVVAVLISLGFSEKNRYFVHKDTEFFVEFPTGPLTVGDERVREVTTRETDVGKLRLLTPTDCVKDRLAAYFHWNDQQAFEQAVLVAKAQTINLENVRRWSQNEGQRGKCETFLKQL